MQISQNLGFASKLNVEGVPAPELQDDGAVYLVDQMARAVFVDRSDFLDAGEVTADDVKDGIHVVTSHFSLARTSGLIAFHRSFP